MLRDPLIAQLGLVDAVRLRDAVETAAYARAEAPTGVLAPLSLETWLLARSGRSVSSVPAAQARREGEPSGLPLLPQPS